MIRLIANKLWLRHAFWLIGLLYAFQLAIVTLMAYVPVTTFSKPNEQPVMVYKGVHPVMHAIPVFGFGIALFPSNHYALMYDESGLVRRRVMLDEYPDSFSDVLEQAKGM